MNAKEQLTVTAALSRYNLTDEFRRRSRAGSTRDELVAWMRATIGDRANVHYPLSLRDIRKRLGCSGTHGGKRPYRTTTTPLHLVRRTS